MILIWVAVIWTADVGLWCAFWEGDLWLISRFVLLAGIGIVDEFRCLSGDYSRNIKPSEKESDQDW